MKMVKKIAKDTAVSTKLTADQNEKLVKLAAKNDITKSALIAHLIEEGYKKATRNKTF